MAKKKIGTIRITRKVTVRTQVRTQQTVQSHVTSTPIISQPSVSRSSELSQNDLGHEVKKLEASVKRLSRPTSLPVGVYSKQVETLYEEFNKRSKPESDEVDTLYDVFISHASEDKVGFVDPLVQALQDANIRVWYDTLAMEWGKSLREQIDNGIKRSKFGIIVLSKNFFSKKWPQRELDGILAKEEQTGAAPLPIWYNITAEEVFNYSPTLSGLYSLSTDRYSIADICESLKLLLNKEEIPT